MCDQGLRRKAHTHSDFQRQQYLGQIFFSLGRVIPSVAVFEAERGISQRNGPSMRRPVGVKWVLGFFMSMFFVGRVATVAMLPSALSRSESVRSVHIGRSRFSRCCYLFGALVVLSLQSGTWARPLTQSPELGFGFCLSSPGTILTWFLLFCFTRLPQPSLGCYCAKARILLHSPTGDAAIPPAFLRWPQWLASYRFFHRARPVSVPSV